MSVPPDEQTYSIHATLISLRGHGVLITGAPGIGKSELALNLIERGAQLVADDSPLLFHRESQLWGHCRLGFEEKLHLQAIGMVNVRKVFGNIALARETPIHLVTHLTDTSLTPRETQLLNGQWDKITVADTSLPRLTLNPIKHHNLSLLVETALRQNLIGNQNN